MAFSVDNLKGIEEHLNNHPTLSEGGVPGPVDAKIYFDLKSTPNLIKISPIEPPTPTLTTGISSSTPSAQFSFNPGSASNKLPKETERKVKKKRKKLKQRRKRMTILILLLKMILPRSPKSL